MKNIILQSSLIFGFLYAVSIIIFPSVELVVEGTSSKLSYDASFRLMIFSILIIDLISWYFIGIYKYQGVSNFISFYVLTVPMLGGFALFISIFIAETIWKKVKTH